MTQSDTRRAAHNLGASHNQDVPVGQRHDARVPAACWKLVRYTVGALDAIHSADSLVANCVVGRVDAHHHACRHALPG